MARKLNAMDSIGGPIKDHKRADPKLGANLPKKSDELRAESWPTSPRQIGRGNTRPFSRPDWLAKPGILPREFSQCNVFGFKYPKPSMENSLENAIWKAGQGLLERFLNQKIKVARIFPSFSLAMDGAP